VLAAVAVVGGTVVLSAGALLVALLAGDAGYSDPVTAGGWLRVIAASTWVLLHTSATLAVALLVTCLITVIGGLRRYVGWTVTGGVCSALLALALVAVSFGGDQVRALVDRATAAIGGTPVVAPLPSPTPSPEPLTVDEARAATVDMLSVTIAAAVMPVTTADGYPPIADASQLQAAPCGESGVRSAIAFELSTGDNAASLPAILAAWDAAGYLPDRAMQEDIRYSATLPVERMSIRDTTTIDGFLHVSIQSACAVAGG